MRVPVIAALLCATGFPAIAEPSIEYGEYLSGECVGCHRNDTTPGAIPQISRMEQASFRRALLAYRSRERSNPTMQTIASRLSDEDIAALALYFESHD